MFQFYTQVAVPLLVDVAVAAVVVPLKSRLLAHISQMRRDSGFKNVQNSQFHSLASCGLMMVAAAVSKLAVFFLPVVLAEALLWFTRIPPPDALLLFPFSLVEVDTLRVIEFLRLLVGLLVWFALLWWWLLSGLLLLDFDSFCTKEFFWPARAAAFSLRSLSRSGFVAPWCWLFRAEGIRIPSTLSAALGFMAFSFSLLDRFSVPPRLLLASGYSSSSGFTNTSPRSPKSLL